MDGRGLCSRLPDCTIVQLSDLCTDAADITDGTSLPNHPSSPSPIPAPSTPPPPRWLRSCRDHRGWAESGWRSGRIGGWADDLQQVSENSRNLPRRLRSPADPRVDLPGTPVVVMISGCRMADLGPRRHPLPSPGSPCRGSGCCRTGVRG